MWLGFLGALVLMGRKGFLIDLPFVEDLPSDSFCQVDGFSFLTCKIKKLRIPPGMPKLCSRQEFPSGMFPGRRAYSSPGGWRRLRAAVRLLLHCRVLSGKSCRARLFGQGSSGKAERE
ncbi:hypothetical protein EV1_044064 [Malus domestica]